MREESAFEFIERKNAQFGKEISYAHTKDIGRKAKSFYAREAWTFLPQHNLANDKVFIFERLRMAKHEGELAFKSTWKEGNIEYRIGYFIRGKIGRTKGRWVWGQYCPLIPHKDLNNLFEKAKREKVILL